MTFTVYLYASFNCSLQAHWDYVKIARIAKLASPGLQQKNAIVGYTVASLNTFLWKHMAISIPQNLKS